MVYFHFLRWFILIFDISTSDPGPKLYTYLKFFHAIFYVLTWAVFRYLLEINFLVLRLAFYGF